MAVTGQVRLCFKMPATCLVCQPNVVIVESYKVYASNHVYFCSRSIGEWFARRGVACVVISYPLARLSFPFRYVLSSSTIYYQYTLLITRLYISLPILLSLVSCIYTT